MTDIDVTQFEEAKTQFTLLLPEIGRKEIRA